MLEVTSYLQVSRWEGRRHMVTLGGVGGLKKDWIDGGNRGYKAFDNVAFTNQRLLNHRFACQIIYPLAVSCIVSSLIS